MALILVMASIPPVRALAEPSPGGRPRSAAFRGALGSRQISGADVKLTLRIYNYVPIDPVTLLRAEKITATIFEDAGIETVWMDCTPLPGQLRPDPVCPSDMGASDLVLRFLPRRMAMKVPTPNEPLGFAQQCPETEPACELTVFYFRVDELASEGYRAETILGHVIAHEMAHVLIGPGHSDDEIMRREWSREELRRMSLGLQLGFTRDQSPQIRQAVLRRVKPPTPESATFSAQKRPIGR
ncbi:MAG: hypothetical protein DMG40_26810 [Acidobacteria bacterium]|nr:MAG: hypothetical protein DMG40_26810 [Acidobacteriota bacterium]